MLHFHHGPVSHIISISIHLCCRSQDSVTAIPLEQWNLDYIVPSILCTTKDNKCIPSSYPVSKGAVRIDVDDNGDSGQLPPNILDPTAKPKHLKGGVTAAFVLIIYHLLSPFIIIYHHVR